MLLFFNLNTKQVRFEDLELILNISTASTPGGYYCFEKGIYSDKPTRRLLIFIMSIPRGSERLWMIGVSEEREREIILDKGQNAYWMVDRYTAFQKFTVMIFIISLLFVFSRLDLRDLVFYEIRGIVILIGRISFWIFLIWKSYNYVGRLWKKK